jgi:tRNA-specific 2-thiouridylase
MGESSGDDMISRKAVALLSGGLDSTLSARIVQEQGINVVGVHFCTGFCGAQRQRRVARPAELGSSALGNKAQQSADTLKISLEIIDVSDDYLDVVLSPTHGYGSNMNPCQDCRAFMLRQAKAYLEEIGADFVVTGEVVGQRPNSQKRHLLYQAERESGLSGLVLRPLSAKLLRPTIPEREGWIARDRLHAISGRGRKPQIEMAARFGIAEYPQPAGGCCLLVEEAFSRRLRDFLQHNPPSALSHDEVALLSVGRHLRLPDGTKVIVGRHAGENNFLERARRPEHWRFEACGGGSPVALCRGPLSHDQVELAAAIVAGFSRSKTESAVVVQVDTGRAIRQVSVAPLPQDRLWKWNIGAAPASRGDKSWD